MKAAVLSCFIAIIFMIQVVMADVFSQLQFMKIISPTNGQSIQAGDKVTVKYVMQPKIFKGTSNGFATRLDINFHKRSGNTKQNQIQHVAQKCPITALDNKFKTYTSTWTVPANTPPGSYAFDFVEVVQYRRPGTITSSETVKVNIVD